MYKAASALIKSFFRNAAAIIGGVIPSLYYIIIICILSGIVATFFSMQYLKNPGPLQEDSNIVIKSGSSTINIAKTLGENNVVKFPQLFVVLLKISESGKSVKAGEYAFGSHVSPMEVIRKMQSGEVVVRKMTIPEGLLTFQVLEIIRRDPALKGVVPDNIGEGELLPETYDYHYDDSRADMVKRMQEAMRHTLSELWGAGRPGSMLQNEKEALVLASIIERETALPEERKRVAAVFINRLKRNMRLQTDASVIYAITNGKYVLDRPVLHNDMDIDSVYNTYRNYGLPPTPIANPGRASIEAAINPLNTDELYFVASGDGGHLFSSTFTEHSRNVDKWRKVGKGSTNE